MTDQAPVWRHRLGRLGSIDTRSLALFRLGLGLLLLVDVALRLRDLTAHYTDHGVLPRSTVLAAWSDSAAVSLHLASGSAAWALLLFALTAVAATALVLGWHTRAATVAAWFLVTSLHHRNPLVLDGGDIALRVLLFWALFLPLGTIASVDARRSLDRPPRAVCSPGAVALLLQVCFVYWFTGLLKWHPLWYQDGLAVEMALQLDQFATPFTHLLLAFPGLLRIATFATLGLELIGPVLVWIPIWTSVWRTLVPLAFIGFHLLGLAPFLHLALFPWVMAVAWIPFLPGSAWDRLGAWGRRAGTPGTVARTMAQIPSGDQLAPRVGTGRGLGNLVVLPLLLYVFVWNLRTVRWEPVEPYFPTEVNWVGEVTGLDQVWDLFAPYPARDDGWFVMPGRLAGGTTVDVWNGGEPSYAKPPRASTTYRNNRWYKLLSHLWDTEHSRKRRFFGDWMCREWNGGHRDAQRLESFEMIYVLEMTPLPGESTELQPLPVFRHGCPSAD